MSEINRVQRNRNSLSYKEYKKYKMVKDSVSLKLYSQLSAGVLSAVRRITMNHNKANCI